MGFLDFFTGGAARRAANAQTAALNQSLDLQRANRSRLESLYQPAIGQGNAAGGRLFDLAGLNGPQASTAALGAFSRSPGYNTVLDNATRGVERSAAARGGLLSGNNLANVASTAGNLEANAFAQYLAQLQGLQSQGAGARNAFATGLTNNTNAQGGILANIGSTNAQGIIGQQNVQNQAIQGGVDILGRIAGFGAGRFF